MVPVSRWSMWPTPSTTTARAILSSPRSARVTQPRRWRVLRHSQRACPLTAWSARMRVRAASGTVFVYSGQGSQWVGMGRQLLADEPVFAEAVAELEPLFVEHVGFSLQQVLAEGEPVSGDARVQPVIMGLQLALTELWRSHGVTPDAVIGHSMGEVTAAVVAGALTVAEGLQRDRNPITTDVAARRAGRSGAADAGCRGDRGHARGLSGRDPRGVLLAAPDGRRGPTGTGRRTHRGGAGARTIRAAGEHGGRLAQRADGSDPARIAFGAGRSQRRPARRFRSSRPSPKTATPPVLDADYWVANVRQPVRFSQAVTAAGAEHTTFVEISAHPMLTQAITEILGETHHHAVGTLRARRRRHAEFPHQPQRHPHHAAAADRASTRATCAVADHAVGAHPPLDQLQDDGAAALKVAVASRESDSSTGVIPAEWYCEMAWPIAARVHRPGRLRRRRGW